MKTTVFTNTKNAAVLYGTILEQLKEEGFEFGLTQNTEPYTIEYDLLDYVIQPVDYHKAIDMDDESTAGFPYVEVKVINRLGEEVTDQRLFDWDLMSAICMLTGVMHIRTGEHCLRWEPDTASFVRILAKYVGITVAITIVAGLTYCLYKKYVTKE